MVSKLKSNITLTFIGILLVRLDCLISRIPSQVIRKIAPRGNLKDDVNQSGSRENLFSDSVPSSYTSVVQDTIDCLEYVLKQPHIDRLLAVDVLLPGLNPKLEQKAMLFQVSNSTFV